MGGIDGDGCTIRQVFEGGGGRKGPTRVVVRRLTLGRSSSRWEWKWEDVRELRGTGVSAP